MILSALALAPSGLLEDDTKIVMVLESTASLLPVWIESRYFLEARFQHARAGLLSLVRFWETENDKVFWSGSGLDRVDTAISELEVIAHRRVSPHDAVKARVVLKTSEFAELEATAIYGY